MNRFITISIIVFFIISCSDINMENVTKAYLKNFDLQGHRGARGLKPENTIPSFLEALKYGVTTLELDVVISKDNQIVVSHEPWFNDKICSKPDGSPISKSEAMLLSIYQMDYDSIKQYDCGKRGHSDFKEQIAQTVFKPTLAMVVKGVNQELNAKNLPPVRYNIEIKSDPSRDNKYHPVPEQFAKLLYDELKKLKLLDKTTVQSFDFRSLQAFHKLDDSVSTAALVYLPESNIKTDIKNLGYTPEIYSCDFKLVTKEMMATAQEVGIKVIPWTVNEVSDMKRMLCFGVDGLITDYPNRAKKLLDGLKKR